MTKLKVAVIGAGYFGRFHHEAWSRMPEIECAATVDHNAETSATVAQEFGFKQTYTDTTKMLAEIKPDIIDITAPPTAHFDLIRQAAPTGAAIQCQKPFCTSPAEARDCTAFITANNLTVSIHENFRYQPWHRQIKALLDRNTLGEVYQATFHLRPGDGQGPDAYLARQPYFQQMERFLVRETAIHQIDLFRYLFGEPVSVFASLKRLNPNIVGEDSGLILFDFPDGPRAVFDGNRLVDHMAKNCRLTMGKLGIEGSRGSLRLDGDGRIWLREHGAQTETEHAFEWTDNLFGGDCVYETCRAFLDHVTTGAPLENAAADYLINREIEDAVYRSNDEGRWIALA